jgi:hypothetical protein
MALPLLAIAAGAGLIGKIAGGAGKGAAAERANQNNFAQTQNQQALSQFGIQQNARNNLLGQQEQATLNRAQLGMQAPNVRMRQALLGSLIQNMQSAKITPPSGIRMGQVSGGIDPSALLNAGARQGGAEMQRQALMALLTKSDVPAATDFVRDGTVAAPQMGGYKKPGRGESILSLIGLLGSAGGSMAGMGGGGGMPEMNGVSRAGFGV